MFSFLLLALPSIHLDLGKVSKMLPQPTAQLAEAWEESACRNFDGHRHLEN